MNTRNETLTDILATIIQKGHINKLTSYDVAKEVEAAIGAWALQHYLPMKGWEY